MTDSEAALAVATDILYREARYLDERRWDEWLALYDEAAEFWIPAWKSESDPTDDPMTEVSLFYTATRSELEDRVWRVRSGKSIASTPLPRTAHVVANVMVVPADAAGMIEARAVMTTHLFNVKRHEQQVAFAQGEHRLVRVEGRWRIKRKKLILLNDYLPTMLDFYTV